MYDKQERDRVVNEIITRQLEELLALTRERRKLNEELASVNAEIVKNSTEAAGHFVVARRLFSVAAVFLLVDVVLLFVA